MILIVIWDDNKKVLNDLVIYCKTQGSQNDQNDWKNEQNTVAVFTNMSLDFLLFKF